MAPSQIAEPVYEPYRPPPVISHERINPFDKNKAPTYDNKTSGIYSSIASNISAAVTVKHEKAPKPPLPAPPAIPAAAPVTFSSVTGFDYSYRPPPLPTYTSKESDEKQDSKPSEETASERRGKFERKLSDADIIFGSKPEPFSATYNYSRNRSNSSFTSTSTDSDYIYSKGPVKDHPFQKSLSVSSEKELDFSYDPMIMDSRAYHGINNIGFSDDTPKEMEQEKPSWSNNDDEFDLK